MVVMSNYMAAIHNRFKDCKITSMYDAGADSFLFMLEKKDGTKMVDNVYIINNRYQIKGYPVTKNYKELAGIMKRPVKFQNGGKS